MSSIFRLLLSAVILLCLAVSARAQCTVSINPSGPLTFCQGGSVNLTASTSGTTYSYTWMQGTTVLTDTDSVLTVNSGGSYTVSISGGNCTTAVTSAPKVITVNTNPVADFTFPATAPCSGTPINFTNTSSPTPGLTYLWNFGDPGSGNSNTSTQTNPSHTFNPAVGNGSQTYTVTLTVTNNYNCQNVVSKFVSVKRKPEASLNTSSLILCGTSSGAGSSPVTVSDNATLIYSNYHINWGDGSLNYNNSNAPNNELHAYNQLGFTNLVYTVGGINGCSNSSTYEVFKGSNPSISFPAPGNTVLLCAPATYSFQISGYSWNPPGTTYTINISDGSPPQVYDHSNLPPAITHTFSSTSCGANSTISGQNSFDLRILASNPCGFSIQPLAPIVVPDKPTADFLINPGNNYCVGSPISFTSSGDPGSNFGPPVGGIYQCNNTVSYQWSVSPSSYTVNSGNLTSSSLGVTFTNQGVYTIKLAVSNTSCGADTITKTICVNPLPQSSFTTSLNPASGCAPVVVQTTNTSNVLASCSTATYSWSVSPSAGVSPATSTAQSPSFTFSQNGNYNLSLTTTNQCGSDTETVPVVIKTLPEVTLPLAQSYCGPQSIAFSAANAAHNPNYDANNGTISSYNWSVTGGASPATSTLQNPTFSFPATGTYTVSVTATNECGTSQSASQAVIINPVPTVTVSPSSATICSGANAVIGLTSPLSGTTFSWSVSAPSGISGAASGTGAQINQQLVNSSSFNITVTYTITPATSLCTGTPVTVSVIVKPSPTIQANPGSQSICSGNAASIGLASTVTSTTFTWTASATGGITGSSNGNGSTIAQTLLNTGAADATVTYSITPTANSCAGPVSVATVTVKALPNVVVSPTSQTLCSGETTLLNLSSAISVATFSWTVNPPAGISGAGNGSGNSIAQQLTNTGAANGIVTYTITPTANGCTGTPLTAQVTVKPRPVVTPTPASQAFCSGGTTNISFSSSITGTTYSYSPAISGAVTGSATGSGAIISQTLTNTGTGNGTVTYVITPEANSCAGQPVSVPVTVYPQPQISVTPASGTICAGAGQLLAATGANSYFWSPVAGLSATTGASVTASPTSTTTYTVTGTTSPSGCSGSTLVTVTVNTVPQVTLGSFAPVCMGTPSFALYGGLPAGGIYSGNGVSGNIFDPAVSGIGTFPVTYSYTTAQGCSATASSNITVNALPIPNAGADQQICAGEAATIGSGNINGQTNTWVSSPSGFSNSTASPSVTPAVTTTYSLTQTITATGCSASDAVTIQVTSAISGNTITADQVLCSGQQPLELIGSAPAGGNGNFTYQWQFSTSTPASWSTITTNGTSASYFPPVISVTTTYRRIVSSGACDGTNASISNEVLITVNPGISNNQINANQTICSGQAPAIITGSQPTGATGTYTYQWESSNTSAGSFTAIPTATNASFTPGILTATTWFRRMVTSGSCSTYSNVVQVTVQPLIAGNIISANQVICSGSAPATLIGQGLSGGSGSGYTYHWQSGSDGITWTNIPAATAQNLSPAALTATTFFRRLVSSGQCLNAESNVVEIEVVQPVTANAISANQTICANLAPALLTGPAPLGGTGTYGYQWQQSVTGNSWTDIAGATGIDYQPGTLTATTHFRRITTSGPCLNESGAIVITVTPGIAGNTISASHSICSGTQANTLTGSVPTMGGGGYTYQWQSSADGTNWSGISGAVNQNYTPSALTSTTHFRRVVSTTLCGNVTSTSAAVIVTVNPLPIVTAGAPEIFCNQNIPVTLTGNSPVGGTWSGTGVTAGGVFTPSVAGIGTVTLTYSYTNGNNCSSSVTKEITVVAPAQANAGADAGVCHNAAAIALTGTPAGGSWSGTGVTATGTFTPSAPGQFTLTYTHGSGTCQTSDAVIITVHALPVVNTGAPQTICAGQNVVLGGGTVAGQTYTWTSSPTGFTSNDPSPNANPTVTTTYSLTQTVTATGCSNTGAVLITVEPAITQNSVSGASVICSGQTAPSLSGSTPAGGNGTFTYQWQSSTTSTGPWATIPGTNTVHYGPGLLTSTTFFRRLVTSGNCTLANSSNEVEVTVNPGIAGNVIGSPETICSGQAPDTLTGSVPTGGGGNYTYQWLSSTSGAAGAFLPLSGSNSVDFIAGALTQTTWFKRTVSTASCNTESNIIQITVLPGITGNHISLYSTTPVCVGGVLPTISGQTPGGSNGSFTYLWQSSTTNVAGSFTPAAGVNNGVNYTPTGLTVTTYFRRQVSSATCPGDVSNVVMIEVNPGISNNSIFTDQIICSGTSPDTLTGLTPGGGGTNFTYQWQRSTTSASAGFTDIAGANQSFYVSGNLTQTTWFVRKVTSGGCTSISNPIEVTVNPLLANNSISSAQTICTGSVPASLSGTVPAGGSGTYVYLWESSTDGSNFATVAGVSNDINYQPNALTQDTWFRRKVTSAPCTTITSQVVKITVHQPIAGNTISAPQTICAGSAPAQLTGSGTLTGGSGNYTYQWEISTTSASAGFTPVATGGTSETYTPGVLPGPAWFRRVVISGPCQNSFSPAVLISVYPIIANNTFATAQTICSGQTPAILDGSVPLGGDNSYTYQWQVSADNFAFVNISVDGTQENYQPGALTQTQWYRRIVTSGGCSHTSASVAINVTPVISNNILNVPQGVCEGTSPGLLSGSTPTGGSGNYIYQWECSTISATTGFSIALGASNSASYNPGPVSQQTWFRRVVTSTGSTCPAETSAAVVVTVSPVIINNTISDNQVICSGTPPNQLNGTQPTGGNNSFVYQWQKSTAGPNGPYANITSANGQNYIPGSPLVSAWYRRNVSSAGCTDTSGWVVIQVNPVLAGNTLSANQTICSGSSAATITGALLTGGDGNYNYQWEYSTTNASTGFTGAPGISMQQNYEPGVLTQTTWYRRVVNSGNCSSTSAVTMITVTPVIANNTISGAQTVCVGVVPSQLTGSLPTGGNLAYSYVWLSSTNGITGFAPASGINNLQNYNPGAMSQPTWYKRVVISSPCASDTSLAVKISVFPGISNNNITADQTICSSTAPNSLAGTTPGGGDGSYVFNWEMSTSGAAGPFLPAPGNNAGQHFSPGNLTQTSWFRRVISSGSCTSVSNVVQVLVNEEIDNNTIAGTQAICVGNTPSTLTGTTPTGGNLTYSYLWISSNTSANSGFASAGGLINQPTYLPAVGLVPQVTWYRRIVLSPPCPADTSAAVQVTINPGISNNTINDGQVICSGQVPVSLTGSVPLGGNGNFVYGWESSTTSAATGFVPAAGTNNQQSYIPGALFQTTWFRRNATSTGCTNTSAVLEITVLPTIANNNISANQVICSGISAATLLGTAPTGSTGNFVYLWEMSTSGSAGPFLAATGINDQPTYNPGILTQTTWYRRVVSAGPCTANTSSVVEVTLHPVIADNSISSPQTICINETPAVLTGSSPSGGSGAYTYLWQISTTDALTGFAAASGANTLQLYGPPALMQTSWFRRIVISGPCASDTSAAVQISVNPVITDNTISAPQTICSGDVPATVSGSLPSGGNGIFGYQWESSTTGATSGYAVISGATGVNYAPSALSQTTWLRRNVLSGGCSHSSNVLEITVYPAIVNNIITGNQTVCSGTAPAPFTGAVPVGGNGVYVYLWEYSVTSATSGFSPAPGNNTAQNYTAPSIAQNTWYRRSVVSGTCNNMSAPILIMVVLGIADNSTSGDQTICAGSTPSGLLGTLPSGGSGLYSYLWIGSTTSPNAGFGTAAGVNTGQQYTPTILTQTTWFKRVVISSPCSGDTSNAVQVLVNQPITDNSATGPQTICSGFTPTTLVGSTPTGGNGSFTYLWEFSTTSATAGFAPAPGNNTAINYNPSALTQTTWFRRKAVSPPCSDNYSPAVQITVTPPLSNNLIFDDQELCIGATAAVLAGTVPTGASGIYSYLWEMSTDGVVFAAAPGVNIQQNYTPGIINQTTWFRRIVTSAPCDPNISSVIEITINPPIAGNVVSSAQVLCFGDLPAPLTGSTPVGGNSTYTFLWQSSTTGPATGFAPAVGTNNQQNYAPVMLSQNTWYRRVVISGGCSQVANPIEITVHPVLANNVITASQMLCQGGTPAMLSGSAVTGGTGNYTYLWEQSTTGALTGFTPALGINNQATYTPGALSQTTWYRRTVMSAPCTDLVSVAVKITVTPDLINNSITTPPQTICAGNVPGALLGTAPSGGSGSYMYLWESSTLSATAGFAPAPGINNMPVYSPPALAQTTWFRRTVISGACTNLSGVVQILVEPAIANNVATANQTICIGTTPAVLLGAQPTGGNGNFVYEWESSTSGPAGGFLAAAGTNNQANYSPGPIVQTTWYRRKITSGTCTSVSAPVQVSVSPLTSGNTITSSQTICGGTAANTIAGSVPAGGSGTYVYQWISSMTSASTGFIPAAGTNNQISYNPGIISQTTWFKRVVVSSPCAGDTSSAVLITVIPGMANNSISSDQTICANTAPVPFIGTAPVGGTGTYTFVWEVSTTNATTGFIPAPGVNNLLNYSAGALTQTSWFRRVITSNVCAGISNVVLVTVTPAIQNNTISADQFICSGLPPAALSGALPTGGSGSYTYQWQMSTVSGTTGFVSAPGFNNSQNYTPGAQTQTVWYRRLVTSGTCSDVSIAVQISVFPAVANNAVGSDQTVCLGMMPTLLTGTVPTGGSGNNTYLWQSSTTNSFSGFAQAVGLNTAQNYQPTVITQTTWFRRIVISVPCLADTSAAIEVVVYPGVMNNSISDSQTICTGTQPQILTGTTPTGGTSGFTYLWESSTTSTATGFTAAAGINNLSYYTPPILTQTTWYRRKAISSPCADSYSNVVEVTVNALVTNNSILSGNTFACLNAVPALLQASQPAGGNGTYSYLWESSLVSATAGFGPAAGINDQQHYQPQPLTQRTWFRRTVNSPPCGSVTSAAVQVDVNMGPPAPVIFNDTICAGEVAKLRAITVGNNLVQWYAAQTGGTPIAGGTDLITPPLTSTTNYYAETVNAAGCPSQPRSVVTATVMPLPIANAGPDVIIRVGQYAQLLATGGVEFTWSPATALNSAFIPNPVAKPAETTTYQVIVTSENGCTAQDDVKVTVNELLQIPHVFTPNYDGINDVWQVENLHLYPGVKVEIFNRWGNIVYEGGAASKPWDGRFNGQDLPVATYYYIITLNEFEEPISGDITIMR